jgi:hypothetical protein
MALTITAYRVTKDGGATIRYVTKYSQFYGDPVAAGTRVYEDNLFRNFLEVATAGQYIYAGKKNAPWTQPIMTGSQTNYGGDLWALDAPYGTNDPVWHLSDGNLQQHIASGHRGRPYPYLFYNPNPLTITSVRICNSYEDYINGYAFWYSDNRDDWTQLVSGNNTNHGGYGQWTFTVPNSGAHRYYEFRVNSGTDGDWQNLSEITMYGTQDIRDDPETSLLDDKVSQSIWIFVSGAVTPWAHYSGQLYKIAEAPQGAYPLTDEQYVALQERMAAGDALRWFDSQRPFTTANWTQPIFTAPTAADGSVASAGSEVDANEAAWKALDGNKTANDNLHHWAPLALQTWWMVVFPYKINITQLVHYNRHLDYAGDATVSGRYWTSEVMTVSIGEQFTTPDTNWAARTCYSSTVAIMTDRIYFQKTGGGNQYSGIGELEITARKVTYEVPL